jgi:hypothetical protein
MDPSPANNIHPTAPEGNREPGFHRAELPARTARSGLAIAENAKRKPPSFSFDALVISA